MCFSAVLIICQRSFLEVTESTFTVSVVTPDNLAVKKSFPDVKIRTSLFFSMPDKHPNFRSVILAINLRNLILETDAPYEPGESTNLSPLLLK